MRPVTDRQWQDAVNAAQTLLNIELGRLYGLATNDDLTINVHLCLETLKEGRARDITPRFEANEDDVQNSNQTLETLTRRHILRVLKASDNNQREAAKRLGISDSPLYRRLRDYKLNNVAERGEAR